MHLLATVLRVELDHAFPDLVLGPDPAPTLGVTTLGG
jgi:hypothetical protein